MTFKMTKAFQMLTCENNVVFKVARLWIASHCQCVLNGIQCNISHCHIILWEVVHREASPRRLGRGTVTLFVAADPRVLILCKWASSLWVVNEAFTVRASSPSNMPTIGQRRAQMTGALLSGEDRHSCMKIAITEQSNFSVMPCYLYKSWLW